MEEQVGDTSRDVLGNVRRAFKSLLQESIVRAVQELNDEKESNRDPIRFVITNFAQVIPFDLKKAS